ncbi:hypothetical protein CC1G_03893 [Coprinopsis cinerea okayama7|uniref:Uncharacterized protein n=1 Tax=Coprinopsis cinerea (strain Okayama-7 / 130 / ATCC MYA-4618 / FGSC 9003) TaxID=240176 RepID=A8NH43_COPC7|nr:hypothetical protein CC1G_03893 [Coprinopsis cinerea okayama7\|eukprot:XP_001833676.1 hypothetical protein CC1G_03893 [Coprinopsis cinerea okayama7\
MMSDKGVAPGELTPQMEQKQVEVEGRDAFAHEGLESGELQDKATSDESQDEEPLSDEEPVFPEQPDPEDGRGRSTPVTVSVRGDPKIKGGGVRK